MGNWRISRRVSGRSTSRKYGSGAAASCARLAWRCSASPPEWSACRPRKPMPLRPAATGPRHVVPVGVGTALAAEGVATPTAPQPEYQTSAGEAAITADVLFVAITSMRSVTPAYAEVIANESHTFRGAASCCRACCPRWGVLAQLRGDGLDLRAARPQCDSNGARPADAPVRPKRGLRDREFRRASEPGR